MDYKQRILRKTGLFNKLTDFELAVIAQSVTMDDYLEGKLIMREGDIGDDMYIVLVGVVQVFTISPDGKEIPLKSWNPYHFFGEQAILPGGSGKRNASVRAHSNVTLMKVTKKDFLHALSKDSLIRRKLIVIGEEQVHSKIIKQSNLFRSVSFEGMSDDWYDEVAFKDGEIIFREGEEGDNLYLIAAGQVELYKSEAGKADKLLVCMKERRSFGELDMLKKEPRTATAIAKGETKLLKIDGHKFVQMYEQTPELQKYMKTLQRVYMLSGHGVVTQHSGKFLNTDSILTTFNLPDGTSAMSSRIPEQNIYNMRLSRKEDKEDTGEIARTLKFQNTKRGVIRELQLSDSNQIIGLNKQGEWSELGKIQQMALNHTVLNDEQIKSFMDNGSLQLKHDTFEDDNQIVCKCLNISRGRLRHAIEDGAVTVEELADETGASTVCGSCTVHLKEMVGQAEWTPVTVSEIKVTDTVHSFRFKPPAGTELKPAKPGQHIVVQAQIKGKWVERPYTISSTFNETEYREITVKRESKGFFSRWLFDKRRKGALIQISDPQGRFYADLSDPQPIVCLVAGIGMTPALAICRSILKEGSRQRLHIDYSASAKKQFVYADELRTAARENNHISLNLRATVNDGRIELSDIRELVKRYERADFYICGPNAYQKGVQRYLTAIGVPASRINVEEFIPVGFKPAKRRDILAEKINYFLPGNSYIFLGLILSGALLLPGLFNWLEFLQGNNIYKWLSGFILLSYIIVQLSLSILRLLKIKWYAHQYRLHKKPLSVIAPVIFYLHAIRFGYAYLYLLSIVFFATIIIGFLNQDIIVIANLKKKQIFSSLWMFLHSLLSTMMLILVIYHIYIVFSY